ncbi:phosphoenolpyruvate hydrolase family protein [Arenibaculum pallidiluteum]|uniref:phosphoenolpyruvate hydrolase family protein n=1 Tax=Arenibaculum pallidiluteum TaxID=2812559 RepID=UPI001F3C8B28|nr:phosphoenolpyruvate hydrolase family protein [Arenibaculum pallidiluteum]
MLPVLDVNGALRAALESRRPFRSSPPIVGIFACDPFLRVADMAKTLHGAGIDEVVNYPTVQCYEGETAAAMASVGYRAEAEFRVLLQFRERGFAPVACVMSLRAAEAALTLGLRRILIHPGLSSPGDAAALWTELAGHVAVEGGEPLGWRPAAS